MSLIPDPRKPDFLRRAARWSLVLGFILVVVVAVGCVAAWRAHATGDELFATIQLFVAAMNAALAQRQFRCWLEMRKRRDEQLREEP